jgi:CTP:molybdopterin cytidylyltransferase MocA
MEINKNIACIILAAGEGRRYGMPKWQAEFRGRTFLEIITEKVINAGISDIACIIRKDSVPDTRGIRYAVNPDPERGMFSSLFYGVKLFPDKSGYLIIPVDHPLFRYQTIIELCNRFAVYKNDSVIKPFCKDRAGHPIIIPGFLAGSIVKGDYEGGLKKFIEDANVPVCNVNIDDNGVLRNINRRTDISS